MSNVLIVSAIAVLFSLSCIVLLALSDPKRHRQGKLRFALTKNTRIAISGFALLPAVALAGMGNISSLLVWMGMFTVTGLVVALAPPRFF